MIRHAGLFAAVVVVAASMAAAQELPSLGDLAPPGVGGRAGGAEVPLRYQEALEHFTAAAVVSHTEVRPGQEFHIAVVMHIADSWVYYGPVPGPIAVAGGISAVADNLTVGEVLWPEDEPYETNLGDRVVVNNVYKGRAVAYVPVKVPTGARQGRRAIRLVVSGQICGDQCVDLRVRVAATVTVGKRSLANDAWTQDLAGRLQGAMPATRLRAAGVPRGPAVAPEVADLTVWAGLGLALLAGLVLNVMPCVLPMVPLRILSLVQMAGQRRRRFVTLGSAFVGGIVLFFIVLAVASVIVRLAAQQALNLSAHFQYRAVRIGLAMVLVALAANLFGLFNVVVPSRLAGLNQGGSCGRGGHLSSVGMGVMMAILATPCSFAILAVVLAWSQIQPLWLGTLAIVLIGVGMAAPHALLVAMPKLLNRLPRPGRWMELFKQSMGFLLLPVAIWMIYAGSDDLYPAWVVAYGVLLTASLWMWGTWVRFDAPLPRKIIIRGLTLLLAIGGGYFMLKPSVPLAVRFDKFSNQRIAEAHRGGRSVLIKFTSATCTSCIWIDHTVYDSPAVADELSARNIVAMKADVTDAGTPASRMLYERFGGAPPLTVLLTPDGRTPVRFDGKFSKDDLFKALTAADGKE